MPSTVNPHGSPKGQALSPLSVVEERWAQEGSEGQSHVQGASVSGSME